MTTQAILPKTPGIHFGYFFPEKPGQYNAYEESVHNVTLVAFHVVSFAALCGIFPLTGWYIQTALTSGYIATIAYNTYTFLNGEEKNPFNMLGMIVRATFMTYGPLLLMAIDFVATVLQEPQGSLQYDITQTMSSMSCQSTI
ncbi:MAG: hypothetical protein AAGF04_00930 [Chlamydiota bacterium]